MADAVRPRVGLCITETVKAVIIRETMAQLTRPAIHPDVPVMYTSGHDGRAMLVFAGRIVGGLLRDATVLIPAPTVIEWIRKYDTTPGLHQVSPVGWVRARIADYTRNGLGAIDG